MDIESLLKSLNARKVKYVVIGATAFPVHGFSRLTFDVDIFIEPTEGNARKTMLALKDGGYDLEDITIKELLAKKVLFRQYATEMDVHPYVKGVSFKTVWSNKVEERIGGTKTYFASLRDLIKMKKAAGRPRDLEDLKILEKIKEKTRGKRKK